MTSNTNNIGAEQASDEMGTRVLRKKSGCMYREIKKLMRTGQSLGPGMFEETIQLQEAWLNNDITYLQAIKEIYRIRKSQKRIRTVS